MAPRLFLGLAVIGLSCIVLAQVPATNPPAIPPAIPTAPTKQDPDRAQKTTAEQITDLTRDKERLEKEIAFVRDRAVKSSSLLREKFATRTITARGIDAGSSAISMPVSASQPTIKRARLMSDEEVKANANALFIVDGRAVSQAQIDALITYLQSFPSSGDTETRNQRASMELIRIESMLAAVPDHAEEAHRQIEAALKKLNEGMAFGDAAKTFSSGPGLMEDGKVTVARFSPFGIAVEAAVFGGKKGAIVGPIRSVNGFVIIQINNLVKGETPDADQAEVSIIQIPFHPEPNEMQQISDRASIGKVDVIARDKAALELLPAFLRPAPTVMPLPGKKMIPVASPDDAPVKAKDEAGGKPLAPVKVGGGN
jgi:parvulin-like peptidyl-prolyl isomerase